MDDQRIYVIAEAIRKGMDYDTIHELTQIDVWFIDKIAIWWRWSRLLRKVLSQWSFCGRQSGLNSRTM